MEVFCISFIFALLIGIFQLMKMSRMIKEAKKAEVQRHAIFQTLQLISKQLGNSTDACSPNSTIRPNNWDSMKEAFKGPVRKDVRD